MELVRHQTDSGYRYGVIVYEGTKWIKIHYVAHAAPKRLPKSELRYMRPAGELSTKQIRRFNQSVRAHGGKRGALKVSS